MTEATTRRRAPGMSPEQRRDMIVQVALPMIAEYGAAVTTAQIARAAGIGEATIFRAFEDKETLLAACVAEVLDPEHALLQLRSIALDQPLADRLLEAADALDAHLGRLAAVLGAVHASGQPNRRPERGATATSRDASQAATRQAIAELIEPDRAQLRLPVEVLADAFLRLMFGRLTRSDEGAGGTDRRQLIDLLLGGALRPAG